MATSGAMADFARMPASRKILIFAVIGGLMFFLYYKFAFKGLSEELDKAEATLTQKKNENQAIEAKIPLLTKLRAKKAVLDQTIFELQKALPTEAEVPAFFETLAIKFTESGVEFVKWSRKPEEPVESFVKVAIDVELNGTFLQLKRFFASLVEKKRPRIAPGQEGGVQERERIVAVENLQLTNPTVRNREIYMTAKFTAVTYRQEDRPIVPIEPGKVPANSPAPSTSGTPAGTNTPPLPSANTPQGAKVRTEDAMKKDEERVKDGTADPGAGSGSARLKGGL